MYTTRSINSTLRSMPGPTPRVKAFNYKLRTNLMDRIAKRLQMERRMRTKEARRLARKFVEKLSLPQLSKLQNRKVNLDRMLKAVGKLEGASKRSSSRAPAPAPEPAPAPTPVVPETRATKPSSRSKPASRSKTKPLKASKSQKKIKGAKNAEGKKEYDNIWAAIMEYDSVKRDREKAVVQKSKVTARVEYSEYLARQVQSREGRLKKIYDEKTKDAELIALDVERFREEEARDKAALHESYVEQMRIADEQIAEKRKRQAAALAQKKKDDAAFLERIREQEREHQRKLQRQLERRQAQMTQAKLDLQKQMEHRERLKAEDEALELRLAQQRADDQNAKEAARQAYYEENKRKREAKQAMMDKFVYSQRREEEERILKATEDAAEAYFKQKQKEEEDKKQARRDATAQQMREIDEMIRIKNERKEKLKQEELAFAAETRRRDKLYKEDLERKKRAKLEAARAQRLALEKQIHARDVARRNDATTDFELKVNEGVIREVLDDPNCPIAIAPDIIAKIERLPKIGSKKKGGRKNGMRKGGATKLPQI